MNDADPTSADDAPDVFDDPTPNDPGPNHPASNRNWWIAIGVALVFLVGAVGYVVGTRVTESSQELNAVDVGFLQDMIDHHDQAVTLGILGNERASDPNVRHFAMEAIVFQRFQIGQMTELLANDGLSRGDSDREAMTWMDMSSTVDTMPGMATDEQVDQLRNADPEEANRLFLELMQAHHKGGVHMAEYELEHGKSPRVKKLAEQMLKQQQAEIVEYQMLQEELGYT